MSISRVFYATFIVFCFFTLPGCLVDNGKVTGGGTMASVAEGHKAVMGFNADSCGGEVSGRFNFHDNGFAGAPGGVKMMGVVTGVDKCNADGGATDRSNAACDSSFFSSTGGCQEGYVISMDYRSTNPKARGSGHAVACVLDSGSKAKTDGSWFRVDSGPFVGYYNNGVISGNVKSHECDS